MSRGLHVRILALLAQNDPNADHALLRLLDYFYYKVSSRAACMHAHARTHARVQVT